MLKCYVIWVLLSQSSCPWYVRPICNSEVRESIESNGFEHKNLTLCRRYWNTVYWWLTFSFLLWRRRRQRLETWLVLVVYCPAAYVPHGRGGQKCHQGNQTQSGEKWDFFYPSQVHILQLQCWCNLLWNWNWGVRDSEKLFHRCNFFDLK